MQLQDQAAKNSLQVNIAVNKITGLASGIINGKLLSVKK